MLVLGIDPGLASTGYALIEKKQSHMICLEYGVIETSSKSVHSQRLLKIFIAIQSIASKYKPDSAAMEELFFARNVSSALHVAEAKGVLNVALLQAGVENIFEYKPNQIKLAVTGSVAAEKKNVQEATKMLLGLKNIPRPDHAADAIAAAITHINTTAGSTAFITI